MSEPPVPEAAEPEPMAAGPEASDQTTLEDAGEPDSGPAAAGAGPVTTAEMSAEADEEAVSITREDDGKQGEADTATELVSPANTPLMRLRTTVLEVTKLVRRIPPPAYGVILLAVAIVGISVAVYFVSSGSSKGQSAAAKASAAAPVSGTGKESRTGKSGTDAAATPGPTPSAPTVRVSPVASVTTPKPLKPSNPAQVKSWNAGKAGAALAQVTEDSGSVLMASGSGRYPEALQACTALAGAVKAAEALPPIPDAAMQKLYVKSLDDFKSGATDCMAAITQHPEGLEDVVTDVSHAELNMAISLFDVGTRDLYNATEFLRRQ
jgi:hypothetical protein